MVHRVYKLSIKVIVKLIVNFNVLAVFVLKSNANQSTSDANLICNAVIEHVELFQPSLRVFRAETWLTVHRPWQVTRRDGLSSWRVILFVAAGMMRGKSAANYVANFGGKVKISHGRT